MRKLRLLSGVVLLVTSAAVVGCEGDALTGTEHAEPSVSHSFGGTDDALRLPFEARLEGEALDAQELDDPDRCEQIRDETLTTVALQSEGTGTHLGRFRAVHSQCIDFINAPLTFRLGRVVFTAADGSELHLAFEGTLIPMPDRPGVFAIENPVEFTKGTGRLDAVIGGHGTARGEVNFNLEGSPFRISVRGTLVLGH